MIQFQQQQPQQSIKQHTRSNFNSENGASSPVSLLQQQQQQQPIQLNKISQYDAKSPGIKKEQQQQGKMTQGKNENLRSSLEDDDDDGFHINLYAKSIPKNKISQQPLGEKKTKKSDEKAVKKDASNGIQTAIAGSASIQRQLSNQQAQFLQTQLARQEASAASSLIDIQKLKYLTQLEKLLPASNNSNNSISNTNLLKNKFEKDQEEEDRNLVNLSANKPVTQSNTSSITTNQYQNNLKVIIPKNGDLGDILAEKMKIIEERKKIITQIDSKSSKDELTFPRTNNQSTKTKSKKRMSLKTENRKTRRSFACKHSRTAKSQQRLSISFDLYSIKESKSEESADGSPLEAQNTSSNLRRGFGARSFFSKVTSTEQLIPSINSQDIIVTQNNQDIIINKNEEEEEDNEDVKVKIISTYNLPTQAQDLCVNDIDQNSQGNLEVFAGLKEQQQKVSQEVNQICSSLEIDQQKSSIENEMESLKIKSNNNTNSDSNGIQEIPREQEQQLNQIQENLDNLRLQNQNLDLKLPIQVIENAAEIKLPNNPRDTLLRCKDESSPKENGLINLYRKNEKEEKQDAVIAPLQNGQKQQLHQISSSLSLSSLGNITLVQSSSIPFNSTAQIEGTNGMDISPTVENIKSDEHNRTTENKKILHQQVNYFPARNNNQSPKQQDQSVNIPNSNKSPLHYMELEIKQLLPSNSKQGQLRKQSEVKVIQFTKPDEKEDLSKTLQRRSSLLDREQENEQVTLKTEGCINNPSRDQRNKKNHKDEEEQEQSRQYSKNYALSPQQNNKRSNLQIDSQFDADRQLLRSSLPQSVQSSANYSSSYKDQFKQRLELQNIRKNPPNNYNIAVYISGDKKRENEEAKQDSACSSPKTVDKSKNRVSQQQYQLQQCYPQQTHQQQQIKGNNKQDKAGSEQSSAKGSSEISSPKLASRMQSEKNKLSVIALQQKIMQQLGKSAGNRRTVNTESEETAIDLQSPQNSSSSNHMKSPNSSTSDKRIIKTIGVASNSHYLNYGHNSAGNISKQCDSVDSQATRIIRTNYDTEPAASDQDNRQSSQKKIPVTIHVSDFTRGNTLAVMTSTTGSSSTDKADIILSKSQQSPSSVVPSNKNLNLNRQAKEEIEKTPTTAMGLSSLKSLPTKLPPGSQKQQFPVPTRSEASMKKQLVVRPLVLDEQPPKRKPSNKFNVESKVKNYILAGQASSQQQGYSKPINGGTVQVQQQARDAQDAHISQGNDFIGEQQGQLQLQQQPEQVNNLAKSYGSKNTANKQLDATKNYPDNQLKNKQQQQQQQQNEYYSQFQPGSLGNSKQSIRSPQIHECQQQSYSLLQSDQQSTSLNPSETASTKGSTHQNGVQFEHEQGNNSKQRSYLSLQLIQQIFTPSEEAAVRQQRQTQRQHSQWST